MEKQLSQDSLSNKKYPFPKVEIVTKTNNKNKMNLKK